MQGQVPRGRYEPVLQVEEIMLTRVTTIVAPRPMLPDCMSREEPLCDDAVDPPVLCDPVEPLCDPVEPLCEPVEPVDPVEPVAPPVDPVDPAVEPLAEPEPVEPLGADELLIGDEPPMRPVTITWWPTWLARFTELSALSRMSRPPLLPLRPAVLGLEDVLPDWLPVDPEAPDCEPVEPAPDCDPVEPVEPVAPDCEPVEPVEPEAPE